MVGDQSDIVARIQAVLPSRWFADISPVLSGILNGIASAWATIYNQLSYSRIQTRIKTSTDVWLDMASLDFFGADLPRRLNESDADFRQRILLEMVRVRGTRPAVVSALVDLTGRAPIIVEPWRPADTGAWGSSGVGYYGLAYGEAGAWGSHAMPYEFFVTAYRPVELGVPHLAGYGDAPGGYGAGSIAWVSGSALGAQVSDSEIYQRVAEVLPACATAWVGISA
jgi:hypothetical protein